MLLSQIISMSRPGPIFNSTTSKHDARSEALWQEAIQRGHLKNTQPDRINFFAAIAHALRVAKHNACGLLRTVVEQGHWHFLSQADEYNAIQRLRRSADAHETKATQWMHTIPSFSMHADSSAEVNEQPALSKDALTVQTLTADLQRAGVKTRCLSHCQNARLSSGLGSGTMAPGRRGTRASSAAPGTSALPGNG